MTRSTNVARGQYWTKKDTKKTVRVMAVADNWVMCRHTGCVPFCVYYNDFVCEYRKPEAGEERP